MMQRVIFFSLASILFLALEKYVLNPQQEYYRLQDRIDQLDKNLSSLENKITQVNWEDLGYYEKIKLLLKLKNSSPNVQNIRMFASEQTEYIIRSAELNDNVKSKIFSFLEDTKFKPSYYFFSKETFYSLYKIKSGYPKVILVEWKFKFLENQSVLFLSDLLDESNYYQINLTGKKNLHLKTYLGIITSKLARELVETEKFLYLAVVNKKLEVITKQWPKTKFYLVKTQESLTWTEYYGFYMSVFSFFILFSVFLSFGLKKIKTPKKLREEEEKDFAGLISDETLKALEQKSPQKNEKLSALELLGGPKQQYKKDQLYHVENKGQEKFILIDPVLYFKAPPQSFHKKPSRPALKDKDERIKKLRERVFGLETKELIQNISSRDTMPSFAERLEALQKKLNSITFDSEFSWLNKILSRKFRRKSLSENILESLPFLCNDFQADGVILLRYDRAMSCYEPFAYYGVEKSMAKSFYVLPMDKVIQLHKDKTSGIVCTDESKKDPFFRKRFNHDKRFIKQLKYIWSLPLHSFGIDGFMILLYMVSAETIDIEYNKKIWKDKINNIIPLLRLGFRRKNIRVENNLYSKIIDEFRNITKGGREPTKVIHIKPKKPVEHSVFEQLASEINGSIERDERLIYNSPSHLILFLKKTPESESEILWVVEKAVGEHELVQFSFPEEGELLNYYF